MGLISLDVYMLIARMNANEKAYFKKIIYKDNKKNKTELLIWHCIEKAIKITDSIDDDIEKKVLKLLKDKVSLNEFRKYKTNLYQDILSCLRQYEYQKSKEEKVIEYYQFALILCKKNLFKEALLQINKAGKICFENEFFELNTLVAQLKAYILSRVISSNKADECLAVLDEKLLDIDRMKSITELEKQHYHLTFLQKKIGLINNDNDIEKFKTIISNVQKPLTNYTFRAELYRLVSHSTAVNFQANQNESFKIHDEIITLINKNPILKENHIFKYLAALEQYLQYALLSFQIEKFESRFKDFTTIKTNNDLEAAWKEIGTIFLSSIFSILTSNLNEFYKLEKRFNILLRKNDYLIPSYRKVSIAHYMVSGFFMLNQYKNAIEWYNYIHNYRHLGIRFETDLATRIMCILSYYELKKPEFMEAQIKNLKYFFEKSQTFKIYKVVLSLLNQLILLPNETVRKNTLIEKEKLILAIIEKDINERYFLAVFDIVSWIESKKNKVSFYEVWKRKNIPATNT